MIKNLLSLKLSALLLISCGAASAQSCCYKSTSTEAFAMLRNDDKFVAAHINPLPINYVPAKGKAVTFAVAGGAQGNAFMVPAIKKTSKYLIVIHEWWGLNDYIKKQCEEFSVMFPDINIIALDLYDGKVATDKDKAAEYMQAATEERCRALIKGLQVYVGAKAECVTVGWCFGGGWSLQTAMYFANQTKGCIMYYGMPEKDNGRIAQIGFPVLGIFAKQDQWISPEVYRTFETNMRNENKIIEVLEYDAAHAFANPSNPGYDEKSTSDAMTHVKTFIGACLYQ